MTSQLAVAPVAGTQQPRISTAPAFPTGSGAEAVELARMAGLFLDPWQEHVLATSLGERADGKWASFEVGLVVPRQNGKGSILEARELAGLFLLGERLLIHSAHEFPTSLEAFRRLLALIEDTPDLERRIMRVSRAHGEEGIELKSGQRIRFRTRTKGGGRGFTGDLLVLDEAMFLPETAIGALLPTLSARPNPQVWYTGSAVDQEIHDNGMVLSRIRKRGITGEDGLAYFEWSAAVDSILQADDIVTDERAWADANPGLGIRISAEHIAREQRAMDARTFAVERLGIGDWPDPDAEIGDGLDLQLWRSLTDATSQMLDPVALAFDVRPNRAHSAIAAAGRRDDGLWHVEVVDHRPGTGWLAQRLAEIAARQQLLGVDCDKVGPAGALLPTLHDLGVKVNAVSAQEHAQGCGLIFDAVEQRTLRHLGSRELEAAVKGAVKRALGDAWAWSRKSSAVDISPLVAATLALRRAMAAAQVAQVEVW